ncbi:MULTISPECIES: type II toxin-antitoxin system YhaV family toxin [Planktothrix]|uniref:type II toxin-antitoxin system YhaV family toxin n=1 Tax=Planktothrix TaxID=54304 RepID=UPI00047B6D43|nr:MULTISPECIES: type II toxin-antitoxin system YhaV family toxin [Planktothrix]
MNFLLCNGCKIYFHPAFSEYYNELVSRTKKLKSKRSPDEFAKHPEVKLLKSLIRLITEVIPADPNATHFKLNDNLSNYKRVKKMGLEKRHRLFFKYNEDKKEIVILWLGFPRKQGDKKDCYTVFTKMVESGKFPDSFKELVEDSSIGNFEEF